MSDNHLPKNRSVSAEQVTDYLRHHPDFFTDRASLLTDMYLMHESGDAISLVERQIALLRERNVTMRQHIDTLLNNANNNDRLFEKTKRLILELVDAKSLADIADVLAHSFHSEFGIDYTSLLIYGEQSQTLANGTHIVSLQEVQKHLPMLIDNRCAVYEHLSTSEQDFVFNGQSSSISSMAVTQLNHLSPTGLLAIGHRDANYFHSGMDTLFLSHIGDVLARLLPSKVVM